METEAIMCEGYRACWGWRPAGGRETCVLMTYAAQPRASEVRTWHVRPALIRRVTLGIAFSFPGVRATCALR